MILDDDLLKKWADEYRAGDFKLPEIYHGDEDDGTEIWRHWGVQIGLSLYFYEEDTLAKRETICQLAEAFQALTDNALQLVNFGRGGAHTLGSKYGLIRGEKGNWNPDESFYLKLSSGQNRATRLESTAFYFSGCVNKINSQQRFEMRYPPYSYLRLQCPEAWFAETKNHTALLSLFRRAIVELKAEQGYGGLSWSMPIDIGCTSDFEYTEHYFAQQFYGMDIDKPSDMTDGHGSCWPLECGMRSPSWITVVGPTQLAKMGGHDVINTALAETQGVSSQAIGDALWLQDGEFPQLYPVEQGIPESMTTIAEAIKPLRAETLKLISYPRWDGDEEIDHVFFDLDKCRRWLARFDRNGDWPSAEQRFWQPSPDYLTEQIVRVFAGEACAHTGYWYTPAKQNSRTLFKQGDVMPDFPDSSYGATIWYWDQNQD